MRNPSRKEGKILLAATVVQAIFLVGIIVIGLVYDISQFVVTSLVVVIASVLGGFVLKTYDIFTNPQLIIGSPDTVTETNHRMGQNTNHLRIPVSTNGKTVYEVYATVVDHSDDFPEPRGDTDLLWARHYDTHQKVDHSEITSPLEVLEHMGKWHLSAAGPVDSISANRQAEYVNVLISVEGIEKTFLADAEGSTLGLSPDDPTVGWGRVSEEYEDSENIEYLCGHYELDIEIGGQNVHPEVVSVEFRVGPEYDDLSVIKAEQKENSLIRGLVNE